MPCWVWVKLASLEHKRSGSRAQRQVSTQPKMQSWVASFNPKLELLAYGAIGRKWAQLTMAEVYKDRIMGRMRTPSEYLMDWARQLPA